MTPKTMRRTSVDLPRAVDSLQYNTHKHSITPSPTEHSRQSQSYVRTYVILLILQIADIMLFNSASYSAFTKPSQHITIVQHILVQGTYWGVHTCRLGVCMYIHYVCTHTCTNSQFYTYVHTYTDLDTQHPCKSKLIHRMHAHTHTHTHCILQSHPSIDTSFKDLTVLTALSRAAVTEEGRTLPCPFTVSFSSVVHFERAASIADGRVPTCKEDGVTCMSCDTNYRSECEINSHCSVGECVWCVHFTHKHSLQLLAPTLSFRVAREMTKQWLAARSTQTLLQRHCIYNK